MADASWLWMAALTALLGMGWLALSLETHWRQVVAQTSQRITTPALSLRLMGALSLAAALLFCLLADHASMAVLVWIMFMAVSAASIAMMLTWQPHWLRWLALPWSMSTRSMKR